MNRNEMVTQTETDIRDYLSGPDDAIRWTAQQIVATLFPQVSTVEELRALPVGTVVITTEGDVYTSAGGAYYSCDRFMHVSWDSADTLYERVRDDETPLMVVFTT